MADDSQMQSDAKPKAPPLNVVSIFGIIVGALGALLSLMGNSRDAYIPLGLIFTGLLGIAVGTAMGRIHERLDRLESSDGGKG